MLRILPAMFALVLVAPLAAADGPQERATNDRQIIELLARIHDQGAALFNAGDHGGCYRMFQGSLATIKLIVPRELQEHIERGMGRAELEPVMMRRALALHNLIEDVRKKLHPTAGQGEKLPLPKKVPMEGGVRFPGVPTKPPDKKPDAPPEKKIDGDKAGIVDFPNAKPVFSSPEPPRAPAIPPGKIDLDPPPPVVSGLPTSNPKPARPMPLDDVPTKDPLDIPPKPVDPLMAPAKPMRDVPLIEIPMTPAKPPMTEEPPLVPPLPDKPAPPPVSVPPLPTAPPMSAPPSGSDLVVPPPPLTIPSPPAKPKSEPPPPLTVPPGK